MQEEARVRDKVVLVGLNSPVLKREENADEQARFGRNMSAVNLQVNVLAKDKLVCEW